MEPRLIKGSCHQDHRGTICFNNEFNALGIKRMYTIQNAETHFVRAWQGHQTEQRWFSAVAGSFIIKLIKIDSWENPAKDLPLVELVLKSESLDVLHVPAGYISSIQSLEADSKLLVFADYILGEIADEYRFPADYFN
ncbi:WxcM-like domain-containing protein [Chryseobacterium salivictor]|nr:WxcM-like domain-containing protein [Chryseobacterium salivictor]